MEWEISNAVSHQGKKAYRLQGRNWRPSAAPGTLCSWPVEGVCRTNGRCWPWTRVLCWWNDPGMSILRPATSERPLARD